MLTTTSEDDAEDAETNLENNFGLIGTTNKRLRHSPKQQPCHDEDHYTPAQNTLNKNEERRGSNSVRVEKMEGKACDRREGGS
ncbi:hypothetical protein BLNAU_23657 [Blattamonas nauphoetae]|uniref:Uncharacterized protein n=1 Tax=Blattamonas nauphoetae TaxID=2049346 RepID=A0ABQ9WPL0_9EUKA|nr:hypothetical protein BLNAU_23657 [Blattamonas nauphoetae]